MWGEGGGGGKGGRGYAETRLHKLGGTIKQLNMTAFIFLSPVPSTAPSNVNGDRIDGTRMRVSWDPLTLEQARGFITHYTVLYQSSTLMEVVTVPGNETTVVIGGLDVTQSYSISVSAGTSVGNGEPSPAQTVASKLTT